jgi:hypothetical protein
LKGGRRGGAGDKVKMLLKAWSIFCFHWSLSRSNEERVVNRNKEESLNYTWQTSKGKEIGEEMWWWGGKIKKG